jgi:hypothetical protein
MVAMLGKFLCSSGKFPLYPPNFRHFPAGTVASSEPGMLLSPLVSKADPHARDRRADG